MGTCLPHGGFERLSCARRGADARAHQFSRALSVSAAGRPPRPVTFHPNVYSSGLVCLGFKWLPTEGLDLLVKRVAQIITFDPAVINTDSPANASTAHWYMRALAQLPRAFPTDRLDFLSATSSRPKPQWRDIATGAQQPASKRIQCEKCPQKLRVPNVPGTTVRCPRCLHTFQVAA